MKINNTPFAIIFALLSLPAFSHAQGTAFTYQGRLNVSGALANGRYDIQFALFATNTGGSLYAGPVTNTAVAVTNGLFTTTVDFGPNIFVGASNWLGLAVSTNGANSFTTLAPRQQITPTPYALYSDSAATAGSAATANSAASVPASGVGPGTANINISGNAATATSAAAAASAVNANFATSATTAATAGFATNALFAGTATNALNFSGAVADGQLSTNIARLNGTNLFTGTNTFSNVVIATNPANVIYGTFTGSGAGLSNLTSVSLAPGSITAAMLAPDAVTMLGTPGNGPTNAVNVSSNGNVGIGISNNVPVAGLQIASGANETILQVLSEAANGSGGYSNLYDAYVVAVTNNLLAVGAIGGVTLVNISNPSSPGLQSQLVNGVGVFTNLGGVGALAWAGSNLVAGAFNSSALTIISYINPVSPVKIAELRNGVGGWNYLNYPAGVAVSGNLLAIADYSSNAVTLVDVSNPANPVKLAEIKNGVGGYSNMSQVHSVALNGGLLAIAASGSSTVTLVDVSNPASPVLKAQLVNGVGGYNITFPSSVALSGTRLAIAGENSSAVTLVDVSNPATPVLLAAATAELNGADYLGSPMSVTFAGANLVTCGNLNNGSGAYGGYTVLSSSTQAVGLDSANWVGIGTTHPQAALDVVGNVIVEGANLFNVNASEVTIGLNNSAGGYHATAIGEYCVASGSYSTALGLSTTASGPESTAMGYYSIASGDTSTAMGYGTTASGAESTAMGGNTTATGNFSFAGGYYNVAAGTASVVGGGGFDGATIGTNFNYGNAAIIGSGLNNLIYPYANYTAIVGGLNNVILPNSPQSFIGGGYNNSAFGDTNNIGSLVVCGGYNNSISSNSWESAIVGGANNAIDPGTPFSFIGGGLFNQIYGDANGYGTKVIVGGYANSINTTAWNSAIVGGQGNVIGVGGTYAFIGGGIGNTAGGSYATVPGGYQNTANGAYSFAAGSYAQAANSGSFVWADNSSSSPFTSTNNNSFNLRATGGVRIATTSAGTVGALLAPNATSWTTLSDRNAKKNFAAVNGEEVLNKLASIPIEQWNYKWENDSDTPNIGPMAQDFKRAFYPGRDDKGITTLEFDGVELAAIQGLNEKVEGLKAELNRRDAENAELKARLEKLESRLEQLTPKK